MRGFFAQGFYPIEKNMNSALKKLIENKEQLELTVDSTFDVDMFGLLIILGLAIGLVRYINGRVEKWDIRNEHRIFRINWNNGKKMLIAGAMTWMLYTIEDDIVKIQWSAVLISAAFILGWLFTLIGNIRIKK